MAFPYNGSLSRRECGGEVRGGEWKAKMEGNGERGGGPYRRPEPRRHFSVAILATSYYKCILSYATSSSKNIC